MAIIDNYTKEELENIVKNSSSIKEVILKLGYSTNSGSNSTTVKNRLEKYNIDYSHFGNLHKEKRNEENIFIEDSTASQQTLRRWYIKGNYTEYKCSICGQLPIWQNKELTLILDHINGHNKDNRLKNLRWVCPNCNQQLDTTGFKKIRVDSTKHIEKKYYCIDCGKEITKNATRCVDCANKSRQKISKEINREELKDLIRRLPFTQAAKEYNITDNGLRKWCDKYNLPRTKKEINSYSDEEWKLI